MESIELIDVRDMDEWEAGHIDGVRHVPLELFRADPEAVLVGDTTFVFVCATGVRMQAAKLSERFGYDRVYSLEGGTKESMRRGLPVVVETRAAA